MGNPGTDSSSGWKAKGTESKEEEQEEMGMAGVMQRPRAPRGRPQDRTIKKTL